MNLFAWSVLSVTLCMHQNQNLLFVLAKLYKNNIINEHTEHEKETVTFWNDQDQCNANIFYHTKLPLFQSV